MISIDICFYIYAKEHMKYTIYKKNNQMMFFFIYLFILYIIRALVVYIYQEYEFAIEKNSRSQCIKIVFLL